MDVISEIKQFESHPERSRFSALQINDFFKTLSGRTLAFEAIITSVRKNSSGQYEILADTFAYSILHNPVSDRDYLNWAPDLKFCCVTENGQFKFNPLTDLIKGDRFHCSAIFLTKEGELLKVKLTSFDRIPFLEAEKEKELLEKKFNQDHDEKTIYAPQRKFRRDTSSRVILFGIIGALIGFLIGLFWAVLSSFFEMETSFLITAIEGSLIGGLSMAALAFLLSMLGSNG